MAKVKWYNKTDSDASGNQFFELDKEDQVMQCNVFVRSLGDRNISLSLNQRTGLYKLDKDLDAYIKRHGSLSS